MYNNVNDDVVNKQLISCHIATHVCAVDFMCCRLACLTLLYLVATGLARYTI